MGTLIWRLWREEEAQDLIEYALLAAFIAIVSILMMQAVGTGINAIFSKVKTEVDKGK